MTDDREIKNIQNFALMVYDSLKLPEELRTGKNASSMLLLVQSQKLTRKRVLLPKYERAMKGHLSKIC